MSLTPDGNHLWRNDGPGPRGDWRFTEVLGAGSDTAVHVGLGASEVVDGVQIMRPDGAHQTLTDVPADRVLEVAEP